MQIGIDFINIITCSHTKLLLGKRKLSFLLSALNNGILIGDPFPFKIFSLALLITKETSCEFPIPPISISLRRKASFLIHILPKTTKKTERPFGLFGPFGGAEVEVRVKIQLLNHRKVMGQPLTYPAVNGDGLFTIQSSGTSPTKQVWGCIKRKNLKEPYVKTKWGFENFEVTLGTPLPLLVPSEMRI